MEDTNIFSQRRVDGIKFIKDGSLEAQFVEAITEQFTVTKLQAYDILALAEIYAENKVDDK